MKGRRRCRRRCASLRPFPFILPLHHVQEVHAGVLSRARIASATSGVCPCRSKCLWVSLVMMVDEAPTFSPPQVMMAPAAQLVSAPTLSHPSSAGERATMASTGSSGSACVWVGRLPQGLRREVLAGLFRALPGYYGTVLRAGRKKGQYVPPCQLRRCAGVAVAWCRGPVWRLWLVAVQAS